MAINYFDQLVQGFGGQEDELTQAIDALGIQAQAPQVVAPQAGSIEELLAGRAQIQDLAAQRAAALADLSAVGAQRPSKRLLREGQSFMEAFRDPSEAQREFAIRAGMALLSDDGTKSLSQRIGQALGSGAQGLQEVRQADVASQAAAAKAKFQQLGIEQQAAQQQFGLTKDILEAQRLAQPKAPTPSPVVKLFGERELALSAGNKELADTITDQIQELTGANVPVDLDRESTKAIVSDIKTLKENADKSRNWLASAQRAENALNSGAETGAFAEGVLGLKKLAGFFGVGEFEADVDASEALAQVLGGNVLELLSSGALGTGTGLSDNDVKFAKEVTGGTIALTEETIRYAIDAKRRAANYARNKFNDEVQGYASTFKDIGKTPAYIQQQSKKKYEIVPFKPISKQAQLLYGTEEGTLQDLQSTTGVLSPANAEAIGNPVYKDVSTEDLLLQLMQSTAGQ
jgi:hypothetical protein